MNTGKEETYVLTRTTPRFALFEAREVGKPTKVIYVPINLVNPYHLQLLKEAAGTTQYWHFIVGEEPSAPVCARCGEPRFKHLGGARVCPSYTYKENSNV